MPLCLPRLCYLFPLYAENALKYKEELLRTTCDYIMTKMGLFGIILK